MTGGLRVFRITAQCPGESGAAFSRVQHESFLGEKFGMSERACPVCQKEVPPRPGRGRPKSYCAIRCRRRREHEREEWDVLEANRGFLESSDWGRRMIEKHPVVRP
jgi:hypothetical protein